ncbi:MAG: NUDIX domain-containing protein [Phycisphaerae bacterium]|nr:NUDIX domain-containing protein [Phycisphaerae bacterium]
MADYIRDIRKLVGTRPLFVPGVRAIVVNDAGEILLQRRTDVPVWCLPGGAVELEETAVEALKREVLEETGLTVLSAEAMGVYTGPEQQFAYPNGDVVQCFAIAFIVRRWEGQPRADGVEGHEVRFFPPDRMPDNVVSIHHQTLSDYNTFDGAFIAA